MNDELMRLGVVLAIAGAASVASPARAQEWTDTDGRGAEHLGTVGLRRATPSSLPAVHTVQRGDTLWAISGRYYGSPWEWPRLWSYNPEITNPHWIYPLDQVRLALEGATPRAPSSGPRIVRRAGVARGTVFLRELGYLDRDALEQSGEIVGSPTDHMLLSPYDAVYVRFGGDRSEAERPSGEFTIYRVLEPSERGANETGTLVRILGTVRIDRYDEDRRMAEATLTEALEPIERGQRVAAIPRRFEVVPPVAADRDLETEIVATLVPHDLLGEQQLVFVPVGEEDGVRVGNRFFVTRRSDEWRRSLSVSANEMGQEAAMPESPDEWPEEVVAEARVVSLRPHSAGLWITRSVLPIEIGDHVELREGY